MILFYTGSGGLRSDYVAGEGYVTCTEYKGKCVAEEYTSVQGEGDYFKKSGGVREYGAMDTGK